MLSRMENISKGERSELMNDIKSRVTLKPIAATVEVKKSNWICDV